MYMYMHIVNELFTNDVQDVHLLFSKRISTQCKSFLQTDLILIVKIFPRLMQYLSLCVWGDKTRALMT